MMSKMIAAVVAFAAVSNGLESTDDYMKTAFDLDGECDGDDEQCTLNALQLKAKKIEVDDAEQNACTSGYVGQIRSYGKECIDSCQSMCPALGQAVDAYLKSGGQPAAKRSICSHPHSFDCAYTPQNIGKCLPLIKQAAGFGFKLPESASQLK